MDTFFSDKKRWTTMDVASLLVSNNMLTAVTTEDAREFVRRMKPCRVKNGTVLFREGEKNPNFMVFILQGEAVVESSAAGHSQSMVLKLLGEGDIIGELGIIDDKVRSATVTAVSEMALAIMDRTAFSEMVAEAPTLACSFLGTLLQSVGNRLRESNRKVHTLTQINTSLHEELQSRAESPRAVPANPVTASVAPMPAFVKPSGSALPKKPLPAPSMPTTPVASAADFSSTHQDGSVPDLNVGMHSQLDVLAAHDLEDVPRPTFTHTYPI